MGAGSANSRPFLPPPIASTEVLIVTESRATSRNQGAENVQHKFEVTLDEDGHCIYRGYSSRRAALDYACEYTGGTLKFKEQDREAGRGRDMGKATTLLFIQPDGQRVAWHKITRNGRDVVVKATAEFKKEMEEQKKRNIAAQERAEQAAAGQYQARENDIANMAQAIGTALGDKLGEFMAVLKGVQADGDKPK